MSDKYGRGWGSLISQRKKKKSQEKKKIKKRKKISKDMSTKTIHYVPRTTSHERKLL